MKNLKLLIIVLCTQFSLHAFARINANSSCPDLEGTYKSSDGATFEITSEQKADGTIMFNYDRDTWVADGKKRDSHTGDLDPQDCPSTITCDQKVLTRAYTCEGMKSVEVYSLDKKGNILVSGQGMGLNGDFVYTRVK